MPACLYLLRDLAVARAPTEGGAEIPFIIEGEPTGETMDRSSLEGIDRYGGADAFGISHEADGGAYALPRVGTYAPLTGGGWKGEAVLEVQGGGGGGLLRIFHVEDSSEDVVFIRRHGERGAEVEAQRMAPTDGVIGSLQRNVDNNQGQYDE